MRKLFWSLWAIIALFWTGCSDETETINNLEQTIVHLIPEGKTNGRAVTAPQQVNGYHLRYVLEAYEEESNGALGAKVTRLCQTSPTFQLELAASKKYTLLAWADYVNSGVDNTNLNNVKDEFYTTTDLQNVSMKTDQWKLNTAAKDAFCTVKKEVMQNGAGIELLLKRPLAMLNVKTKTAAQQAKAIQIKYPNVYTAYNVLAGDVVGSASALHFSAPILTDESDHHIAFDYLFVHPLSDPDLYAQGSTLYNVMINLFSQTETNGNPDTSYEVEFVPFSPNYRTNLTCSDIPTADVQTQVNITVDGAFETPEMNDPKQFLNSSYIRSSFYETGRIYDKSLQTCNDLIFLVANPYFGGPLYFETPENSLELPQGATWVDQFEQRQGVLALDGTTQLDAKSDILNKATGEFPKFTFGTWLYLDEWTLDAYLFKKQNNDNTSKVGLKLGSTPGQLTFFVDQSSHTFNAPALTVGAWHHVALAHNGGSSTILYIDGEAVETAQALPKLPGMNAFYKMYLGSNLKGKLDEAFFNMLNLNQNGIKTIMNTGIDFKNWNNTKTQAYWKFDDATQPGKDSHSWVIIMNDIRTKITGKDIKFRLGISGGDWLKVCSDAGRRTNFAKQIKQTLETYHLDGVDLDFEWSYSDTELKNYSATIVEVRNIIGSDYLFTVSLHPVSYRITPEAIAACDWISFQCYGPKGTEFAYDKYERHIQDALAYGLPANKLVAGVPFYGTKNWNQGNSEGTAAYCDMVKDNAVTNTTDDQVTYKGTTYYLNSVSTIQKKVQYARQHHLRGIMSWDLATDCDYDNPLSLQRTVVESIWK